MKQLGAPCCTLLWLLLAGCTVHSQIEPAEAVGEDKVQVKTLDGSVHVLYEPIVEGDSIKGGIRRDSQVRTAIPLDQVSQVEAIGTHDVGSAALLLTILGAGLLIGIGLAAGSGF